MQKRGCNNLISETAYLSMRHNKPHYKKYEKLAIVKLLSTLWNNPSWPSIEEKNFKNTARYIKWRLGLTLPEGRQIKLVIIMRGSMDNPGHETKTVKELSPPTIE